MDLIKNGEFISTVRNEHNMTQKDLAEKLGVSNKTVSKWENGHSFPDVDLLLPLCKELNITVTDLLNGERVEEKDIRDKAESVMIEMLEDTKEKSENRLIGLAKGLARIFGWIAVPLLLAVVSPMGIKQTIFAFFDIVSLLVEILFPVVVLLVSGKRKDFINGFAILWKSSDRVRWSESEIQGAVDAFWLVEFTLIAGGVFDMLFQFVEIVWSVNQYSPEILLPNIAVSMQSLLYGLYMCIIFESIRIRLKKKIG